MKVISLLQELTLQPDSARLRVLNPKAIASEGHCVLYWMQRAQRGRNNAALNHAIELGNVLKLPVLCCFGLYDRFPGAERRHFRFLVQGLRDAARDMKARNVRFVLQLGPPLDVVRSLVAEYRPAIVVADENPLRVQRAWREELAASLPVAVHAVDADVVVPSRLFPKEEYAARTIRPKIHIVIDQHLKAVPNPKAEVAWNLADGRSSGEPIDENQLMSCLSVAGASELPAYRGGSDEAERRLERFIKQRLSKYATERNEPIPYMTSELSAHLHFGHIDPVSTVLRVLEAGGPKESVDSFVEEFVVRREVAINFCWRNPRYDSLAGCPDWALKTLSKHAADFRPYLYKYQQFENAESHDPLWNAAQKEMVLTGRMHNYLRMYWAKKILEWTPDVETAFNTTLALNDRWQMDGRDPNGYTGVAWAIGGKHDRPWIERPIFGMVRFMSYESTRKKFDSQGYIDWVRAIERGIIKP